MARYKSVHTGPQIDSGVARALPGGIIDQMRSNRNLLDNWDFRNPVNQRGVTAQTYDNLNIDRWNTYSGGGNAFLLSTITGGVRISVTTGWLWQLQRIESLPNGTYAMSVKLTDGTIYSKTVSWIGTEVGGTVAAGLELYLFTSGAPAFRVQILAGYSYDIESVKLELGSVSTLAYDPPADHEAEKAKCKRYFNLWASEAARTAALQEVGAMRTTPVLSTLTISGTTYYTAIADL